MSSFLGSCGQGGRFDCPDRLFEDLSQSWKGCIDENNMSDVKELTPEFFYCPEIFLNSNKLPLGEMQVGTDVYTPMSFRLRLGVSS